MHICTRNAQKPRASCDYISVYTRRAPQKKTEGPSCDAVARAYPQLPCSCAHRTHRLYQESIAQRANLANLLLLNKPSKRLHHARFSSSALLTRQQQGGEGWRKGSSMWLSGPRCNQTPLCLTSGTAPARTALRCASPPPSHESHTSASTHSAKSPLCGCSPPSDRRRRRRVSP